MIIGIVVVIPLPVVLASEYIKSPPDTVFIISSFQKKTIIRKANIKTPFPERLDKLSLKLTPTDVKTSTAVPTVDYISIQVGAAVDVKISSSPGRLAMAAENFLNQDTEYIDRVAREVLEDNVREVVGRVKLGEMISDRQKFVELVKENAMPDPVAMGLDIISFNVQDFPDNNGVINDFGTDSISQIKKKVAIAKAEADGEIAVAKAEMNRQTSDAKTNSDREVAIKNNELDIQKAESKKNAGVKQAEADAAYQIQEEQQRKTIEIITAEANTARQERKTIIKQRVAEVAGKILGAEVRKKMETDKYARQQKAEAELYECRKNAETKKSEVQQEAETQKSRAEAERLAREQETQGVRMTDDAEAETIWAKGAAEAEAMEKKTETYRKYASTAVAEIMIEVLPEVVDKVAEPLAQISKIIIIGGGSDNSGVDNVVGDVTTVMAEPLESIRKTIGIDFGRIVKTNTYDAGASQDTHMTGVSEGDVIGGEIVKNIIGDSAQ